MTKLIIIITSLLASLFSHNMYVEYGTITESNCITDIHGEMWYTENDIKIPLDSNVIIIFNNNGTDYIYDDEIVYISEVK